MNPAYYYTARIGTCHLHWFGGDDKRARRKVSRWIGLFWEAHKNAYPGSIAHAINNEKPGIQIGRIYCPGYAIPCVRPTLIEDLKQWDGSEITFRRGMLCID